MAYLNWISPFDLFRQIIVLRFDGGSTFATYKGLFVSSLIFAIVSWTIINFVKQTINRDQPRIVRSQQKESLDSFIDLDSIKFPFAIGFENQETGIQFLDERFFHLEIAYSTQTLEKLDNGLFVWKTKESVVMPEICEQNVHFKGENLPEDWLNQIEFSKIYCFPSKDLQRISSNKKIQIRIGKCFKADQNCATSEEIASKIEENNVLIYYSNNYLEPKSKYPLQIMGRINHINIASNMKKNVYWSLERFTLIYDKGYILEDVTQYQGIVSNKYLETTDELLQKDLFLMELNFLFSEEGSRASCSFQQFSELMGEITGIVSFFHFAFFLILFPILRMNFYEKFMNSLFISETHKKYGSEFLRTHEIQIQTLDSEKVTILDRIRKLKSMNEIQAIQHLDHSRSYYQESLQGRKQPQLGSDGESPVQDQKFQQFQNSPQNQNNFDSMKSSQPKSPLKMKAKPLDAPEIKRFKKIIQQNDSKSRFKEQNELQMVNRLNIPDNDIVLISQESDKELKNDPYSKKSIEQKQQKNEAQILSLEKETQNLFKNLSQQVKYQIDDEHQVMNLNFQNFWRIICRRNLTKNQKQTIYETGTYIINDNIDIIKIIGQLNEFQRFQRLMLTKDQQKIFSFLNKSVMHYQEETGNIVIPNLGFVLSQKLESVNLDEQIEEAFFAYSNIQSQIAYAEDLSEKEFNMRILGEMDPKIKKAFDEVYDTLKYINYLEKYADS